MKIACCYPDTPQWPKFRWVHEALLDLGHEVRWCRSGGEIAQHEPWADMTLFAHKSFPARWPNLKEIWEKRSSVWVQWWFDLICTEPGLPVADQPILKQFWPHFAAMDLVFIKERELMADFRALGLPVEYLDQGCPADYPEINRTEPIKWDVLLWGQSGPGYKQRWKDVETLVGAGLRVCWAGARQQSSQGAPAGCETTEWIHPHDVPKVASQAAAVLCVDRRNDIDGYWSDRSWMALGSGSACLIRKTGGLPEKHVPAMVYNSPAGLVAFAKALADGETRGKLSTNLGRNARKWSIEKHTIKHRCRALIARVTAEYAETRNSCQ